MATFADLGIPFPLFEAPTTEACDYAGVVSCASRWRRRLADRGDGIEDRGWRAGVRRPGSAAARDQAYRPAKHSRTSLPPAIRQMISTS